MKNKNNLASAAASPQAPVTDPPPSVPAAARAVFSQSAEREAPSALRQAPSAGRRYGWTHDRLDPRDRHFAADPNLPGLLPAVVDLRAVCPPVYDQGQLGSCTGNAIAAAFRFEAMRQGAQTGQTGLTGLTDFEPSRLFIYYNERAMEGTVNEDAGGQIRDGIKSVVSLGVCAEADWPYDPTVFDMKPSDAAFAAAVKHQALQYRRLACSRRAMCACLAQGLPFVFGFTVFESFESDVVAQTGIMPMPGPDDAMLGGHAVLCIGYDQNTQRYLVQNSWGTGWGIDGRFWMPFSYLENGSLADDRWVVSKVEAPQ